MEKIDEKTVTIGTAKYMSPSEGGRLNRSFINYDSGIQELDDYLRKQNKTLLEYGAEFAIGIYDEHVAFILYRGDKPFWRFVIRTDSIKQINSLHEQNLNIRKDSKISGGLLGAVSAMGIVGGIIAGTVDALSTDNKATSENSVLGSIFEIVIKGENEEKIILTCTDKKKEVIEELFNKISIT